MQHHNIYPRQLRGVDPGVIYELAILGGARVLGMEDEIGSLEPGKKADIITIDLEQNSSLFPLSPEVFYAMLALNGAGTETCDVLIDGVFVRRDAQFTFLDEEAILNRAHEWCDKFALDYQRIKINNQPMFKRVHAEFQPGNRRVS
jgi:cytosine/adenosine deaminase-related metal-dependent hydrolase